MRLDLVALRCWHEKLRPLLGNVVLDCLWPAAIAPAASGKFCRLTAARFDGPAKCTATVRRPSEAVDERGRQWFEVVWFVCTTSKKTCELPSPAPSDGFGEPSDDLTFRQFV